MNRTIRASKMSRKKKEKEVSETYLLNSQNDYVPKDVITINNPQIVQLINHVKKRVILELLLNRSKTIIQLSRETGWNPGTVKRHLTDLLNGNLIVKAKIDINEHRIKLKYYRIAAKRFIFHYEWPTL